MSLPPVGIFGGTFDPIHFAHLRVALELQQKLQLQEVRMLPASVPPHRPQPQASAAQRKQMLELALADEPALCCDDRELQRSGPSYMVDTLRSLREELGESQAICLLMGVDAFLGLGNWYHWQQLPELAHIVVAHRPGWHMSKEGGDEAVTALLQRQTTTHEALAGKPAGYVHFVDVTQLEISATAIRKAVAAGYSARYLMPDAVWQYIQDNRLYRQEQQ